MHHLSRSAIFIHYNIFPQLQFTLTFQQPLIPLVLLILPPLSLYVFPLLSSFFLNLQYQSSLCYLFLTLFRFPAYRLPNASAIWENTNKTNTKQTSATKLVALFTCVRPRSHIMSMSRIVSFDTVLSNIGQYKL